jgi:hypothetical protein
MDCRCRWEVQVWFGQPPAVFATPIRAHCRGGQVLNTAGAGKLADIGRDPVKDRGDPGQVDGDVGGVRPVIFRAQV